MKKSKYESLDDFVELDVDHEGQSVFKFLAEIDKRGAAFKRQLVWALANDLRDLVLEKIPGEKRYRKLRDSLEVGEGPRGSFAVFIDQKSQGVSVLGTANTLVYISARRVQSAVNPAIKVLSDYSPWTIDTIPFWPDKRQARVVQRRVDKRTVEKVAKDKRVIKSKIDRDLVAAGHKTNARGKKILDAQKSKASTDLAFEMLTLEFGYGNQRGIGLWRRSLRELTASRSKSVIKRYKELRNTISNPRSSRWQKWPHVNIKIKQAQMRSFRGFQKQLGY